MGVTGSIKWNTIDRLASQVLFAAVGVILANILSPTDYGLVGALLVFQAFGAIFVDSGFGSALLRLKSPTRRDYSTIFWFNLAVSIFLYLILYLCAPGIAEIFQGDRRLIPLSRVMFLTFILNATALVQTTRLMKEMNVKQIAVANMVGQITSGALGIYLAIKGYGAWALVWQSVTLSAVKSAWLWVTGGWWPLLCFSRQSMQALWRVGLSVFSSSALNTFFLYVYNFVIGAGYSLALLGIYTQADKWSKMGSASLSQIITASFVPWLSAAQDDSSQFEERMHRVSRFAALLIIPILCGGAIVGRPLFHLLFGLKWDAAIMLFQILMVRGVFICLVSLLNNYLLALGYARRLVAVEVVKDILTALALAVTLPLHSIDALVWGQFGASALTFAVVLHIYCRATGFRPVSMLCDFIRPIVTTMISAILPIVLILWAGDSDVDRLRAGIIMGGALLTMLLPYYILNKKELIRLRQQP